MGLSSTSEKPSLYRAHWLPAGFPGVGVRTAEVRVNPQMNPRFRPFEILLLGLALALGVVLRVRGIAQRPFFGDEHHTLLVHPVGSAPIELGQASYGEILSTFDMTGSHVVLPLLQRLALDLVGPGPLSYRLPALLPGLLLLCVSFPILRAFFGRTPALLATIALALNPMHVFYSHFGRAYALVMFTSVLLAYCVLRGLRSMTKDGSPGEDSTVGGLFSRHRWWWASFLLAWFTAYSHLSAAGFVALLGLVAIVLARKEGGSWRASLPPLLAFGGAALVCALVFAPIYEQLVKYTGLQEIKNRPQTFLGIPILIFGGGTVALFGLGSIPIACALLWRRERTALIVACTTFVGPIMALFVMRPHGMEYAYARYLLCAIPFLLGFLALSFCALLRRFIAPEARAQSVSIAVGSILLAWAYFSGPIGPGTVQGPFGNCYLAMFSLPAFDEPYPGVPEIYREIAADSEAERIIEFPPIWTRAALLYRNYALTHGKAVTIGYDAPMPGGMKGGPYARLSEIDSSDGNYLVLHREPVPEVRRYFNFVYDEAVPRHRRFGDSGFLERHKATFASNQPPRDLLDRTAAALRGRLGPAWRKSDRMLVWKLDD